MRPETCRIYTSAVSGVLDRRGVISGELPDTDDGQNHYRSGVSRHLVLSSPPSQTFDVSLARHGVEAVEKAAEWEPHPSLPTYVRHGARKELE